MHIDRVVRASAVSLFFGVLVLTLLLISRTTSAFFDLHEERSVVSLPEYAKQKTGVQQAIPIPILMYHYVEIVKDAKDTTRQKLNTPPSVLEKQIQTLKENGYMFVTSSYVSLALKGKITPQKKVVVLTFDDGYGDFYTDAYPILQKEGVPAVVYIIVHALDKPNYMTTRQVEALVRNQHIEIGAHTLNHIWLKGQTADVVKKEVRESRNELRERFSVPVFSFAYPYGAFDEQAERIVREAGFTTAVSTVPGASHTESSRYFLYRVRPGDKTGDALLRLLDEEAKKSH